MTSKRKPQPTVSDDEFNQWLEATTKAVFGVTDPATQKPHPEKP